MADGPMPVWFGVLSLVVLLLMVDAWRRIIVRKRRGRPIVSRRRRRPVPWGIEGANLAFAFVGLTLLAALASADANEEPAGAVGFADAVVFATTWAVLSAVSLAWIGSRHDLRLADFGLPVTTHEAARDAMLGLSACTVALLPVYGVQMLLVWGIGVPSSHPTVEALLADPSWELIVAATLMAVVIAPIFEELAFRVLLQGGLERYAGRRACWPIAVSSTVFAMAHVGQGWAPVPLFVVAIVLGYLYRQTHRIMPIIVMHMAFNALSLAAAIATAQVTGAAT
ncbi:MAG: CPBP family intramembrane glutamic endopeptidase [Planctomycetota bacterium]